MNIQRPCLKVFAALTAFFALFWISFFALALTSPAHAQSAASTVVLPALPPEAANFILAWLTGLAAKHSGVATLITVLGTMRLWAKPLFSLIHTVVELTPSKTDDGAWARAHDWLTTTADGQVAAWLLDYVTSIKLVAHEPAARPDPEPAETAELPPSVH